MTVSARKAQAPAGTAQAPAGTALVLAGRREGVIDPFAAAYGVNDKCLIPVGGMPMIAHVINALAHADLSLRILVSTNYANALRNVPTLAGLENRDRLSFIAAADNIASSVLQAATEADFPLLITTADNCLFDTASIAEFGAAAQALDTNVAVAFARKSSIIAAHPNGQRKFYRFRDVAVSTCNAYWLRDRAALGAVEAFRGGGQFVKHPARIAQAFGILNLVRFRLGMGTLNSVFRHFSRRFRLNMHAVLLTNGACAIDVDNERTLRVTEEIMAGRTGR